MLTHPSTRSFYIGLADVDCMCSEVARLQDPSCGSITCHQLLNQTVDVIVEGSQFRAGIGGHAVRIGNFSRQVHVVGNLISGVGQGGIKLGHNIVDGVVPRNMTGV